EVRGEVDDVLQRGVIDLLDRHVDAERQLPAEGVPPGAAVLLRSFAGNELFDQIHAAAVDHLCIGRLGRQRHQRDKDSKDVYIDFHVFTSLIGLYPAMKFRGYTDQYTPTSSISYKCYFNQSNMKALP